MARARKKQEKTERHVLVCALVVETTEGEDITNGDGDGVIPNLVTQIDHLLTDDEQHTNEGKLHYAVRDVTLFTERGFMWEARKHGSPRRFPDVYLNGVPQEMTVKQIRSAPRKKRKLKIRKKTTEEATR